MVYIFLISLTLFSTVHNLLFARKEITSIEHESSFEACTLFIFFAHSICFASCPITLLKIPIKDYIGCTLYNSFRYQRRLFKNFIHFRTDVPSARIPLCTTYGDFFFVRQQEAWMREYFKLEFLGFWNLQFLSRHVGNHLEYFFSEIITELFFTTRIKA